MDDKKMEALEYQIKGQISLIFRSYINERRASEKNKNRVKIKRKSLFYVCFVLTQNQK